MDLKLRSRNAVDFNGFLRKQLKGEHYDSIEVLYASEPLRVHFNSSLHPLNKQAYWELNLPAPDIAASRDIQRLVKQDQLHTGLSVPYKCPGQRNPIRRGDAVNHTYFTTTKSRQL